MLHLLYARFYTKVLRDLGLITADEPFTSLLSQGMVIKDGAKMSKSKGNVVDPDDLIRRYGADTARLFSLFAAPPEKDLDWNDHGVEGASRFLNRLWRFVHAHLDELKSAAPVRPVGLSDAGRAFRRVIHETMHRVTEDIEQDFHFNTAISAVMELVNALVEFERASMDTVGRQERAGLLREAVETTLLLLGPVCPHITEALWAELGHCGEPVPAVVAGGGPGRDEARRGPDRGPGRRAGEEPAHGRRRRPGGGDSRDGAGRRAGASLARTADRWRRWSWSRAVS